jgi:octaprenyl-diphosphate synthase
MEAPAVPSNAFLAKIDAYRTRIDNALLLELRQRENSVFYRPLSRALKGGKRLRPILLLLSYECTSRITEDPLPAALAVELAHTESLIHDDIIDRDLMRRERAAFHASYGSEIALLSADFILSIILNIIARYKDSRVAQTLSSATSEMCEGELEELKLLRKKKKLGEYQYISIISKKTASLFEASTAIGAIIGGAKESEIETLSKYGRYIGITYQIRDDITDQERTTSANILKLLEKDTDKNAASKELSNSYLFKAKEQLRALAANDAKALLLKFTDFVASNAFTSS